jgi:hypothetical protein
MLGASLFVELGMSFPDHALRLARLLSRVSLCLAAGAACAPVTIATSGASEDGGMADAGIDASPGGDTGGAEPDGGVCAPGDVATYHPVYHPPAVQPTACAGSLDLVGQFFEACLGSGRSDTTCAQFRKDHADCAGCIVTPESAMAYGPIVDHGAFVTANVAGCIELEVEGATDGGSAAIGCAKAVDALQGCEIAACEANCPVSSTASLSQFQGCTTSADGAGCSTFAAAVACTAPDAGAGVPQTCLQTDFSAFYHSVVPLFCLPLPVVEAGAPAYDASASD